MFSLLRFEQGFYIIQYLTYFLELNKIIFYPISCVQFEPCRHELSIQTLQQKIVGLLLRLIGIFAVDLVHPLFFNIRNLVFDDDICHQRNIIGVVKFVFFLAMGLETKSPKEICDCRI